MYTLFLMLHSWLRWGALLAGVLAVVLLIIARPKADGSSPADRWGLLFLIALDVQLLVGLLLYFVVSPNMSAIRADFGAAMRDPVARFWAVEHITAMLVAVVALHVGRAMARKAASADSRRRRLLIGMVLALLAIISRTPWPGMPAGRPLLRVSAQQ